MKTGNGRERKRLTQRQRYIGIIDLRLTYDLNDERLKHGGHIAATVRPSERRKGYGEKMLALALEKCRELNIDKVLITCDKNNIGSANLILKSGGVFENEIFKDDGNVTQRYWISL